jgi:hypothetical protein
LKDDKGTIYLAHSGRVGGGRKGIGKSNFLKFYQGPVESVRCPDGSDCGYIVIGPVDGDHLPLQVAHFVNEVKAFKSGHKHAERRLPSSLFPVSFTPEFSGQRKSYLIKEEVKAECDHGPLISALAKKLDKRKLAYGNDGARDLFVATKSGKMLILFEAKTSLGTSSIYGAVGQLMLHGAAETKAPRRVLVVPGTPTQKTNAALNKLGIKVLSYKFKGKQFTFAKLNDALQ